MSEIKTCQNLQIDNAKVRAVVERVTNTFRLSAEKVVASHSNPNRYPLTTGSRSAEDLLLQRFRGLPADRQKAVVTKTMAMINATASSRKAAYGDLAAVDLTQSVPVRDQVHRLAFPSALRLTAADLGVTGSKIAARGSTPIASSTAYLPMSQVELRVHKVKCTDDTNELAEGKDEISLGGATIDATGKTAKISAFKVGDFKAGDTKEYTSPKTLAKFSLSAGSAWPKTYFVSLALAETDSSGGFTEFLDGLLAEVEDEVTAALAAALGAAIGASGGPVTALIGAAVGVVVAEVFSLLKSWWGDDIFEPVTVSAEIASTTDRWSGKTDSPEYTAKFADHGAVYTVTYDWKLS